MAAYISLDDSGSNPIVSFGPRKLKLPEVPVATVDTEQPKVPRPLKLNLPDLPPPNQQQQSIGRALREPKKLELTILDEVPPKNKPSAPAPVKKLELHPSAPVAPAPAQPVVKVALKNQATIVASETLTADDRKKYPDMSDARINRVKKLVSSTDITDRTVTMEYGVTEASNMAKVVDKMVQESLNTKTDTILEKTNALMALFEKSKKAMAGGLFRFSNPIDKLRDINSEVDGLTMGLDGVIDQYKKSFASLDVLYDDVKTHQLEFAVMIAAGKELLAIFTTSTLPSLQRDSAGTDPLKLQIVADKISGYKRFEKKVSDLENSSMNSLINAKQIRMAQETTLTAIDGINNLLFTTIPMWRTQLVGVLSSGVLNDTFVNTNSTIIDSIRNVVQPLDHK